MTVQGLQQPDYRFRFAPSPNGRLHLGHAYCALLNQKLAHESNATFLLRIEDIDLSRCTPQLEHGLLEDLAWLGMEFPQPIRRQSEHFSIYQKALDQLIALGLAYPSVMTRGEINAAVKDYESKGAAWPRDPDRAPIYPGLERHLNNAQRMAIIHGDRPFAWRLDMRKALGGMSAPLLWDESGEESVGQIDARPERWGDVILSRSDAASSYHLSVVVDDALQGITNVVRGMDLFEATSIHRLLQVLLGLPAPRYHHHRLILDEAGRKLSKSNKSTALFELREAGISASDIRALVGF